VRRLALTAVLLLPQPAGATDWPGYEKLTREQVVATLAGASPSAPADFYSRNLSGLDLSGIDFKGANLSAAVLNRANLTRADLSRCNLTVSFAEGANLTDAKLQGAMMFSMQLQGADLKRANLSGARFIGDLRRANLEQAVLTKMNAAADMKNQSMGLMRANLASANLRGADLSGSDFSRADFSFADLSGATLAGARLSGAELSGTDLRGANLAGADLSGSKLVDTDFTGANLANADFAGATLRGVKGLPVQTAQQSEPAGDDRVLRVCGDPNNLPFSNRAGQGFENKIAELLARELGWRLEYTWFPQRMGFIRNTLRARDPDSNRFKCDLVMGVPAGFELASTTKPYYRSTYALVYVKGKGLDSVTAPEGLLKVEPAKLKSLKLGVFGQSPTADWLLKHRLFDQAVSYQPQSGDPERYPGEIIEKDLVAGKVDVAFVWGPIAGYFAKNARTDLAVVPFAPSAEIQFDFRIAMGVRFGEREWKDRIERLIEANRSRIQAILAAYGVPQLDDAGRLMTVAPDASLTRGDSNSRK
jgi:quinoprotein dehydrogenase-associated probable ABC transporter substrate-binding protein